MSWNFEFFLRPAENWRPWIVINLKCEKWKAAKDDWKAAAARVNADKKSKIFIPHDISQLLSNYIAGIRFHCPFRTLHFTA